MAMAVVLSAASANAQSSRQQFTVSTTSGDVLVESFGECGRKICPAIIILSGSRGFAAPAYDDLGKTFQAAGLNAYLVHAVSTEDVQAIGAAAGARQRIAYYAQRLPDWISAVRDVAAHLRAQSRHGGKVGILGISLGAQVASAASEDAGVDALVLVDGGFPSGYSPPAGPLPPLLLIWGSDDRVFPLSVARDLKGLAQRLGGPVALDVYEGGAHDFFLQSESRNARAAYRSAADYLASRLSQ